MLATLLAGILSTERENCCCMFAVQVKVRISGVHITTQPLVSGIQKHFIQYQLYY